MWKGILIGIGCILLVLIVLGLYFFYMVFKKPVNWVETFRKAANEKRPVVVCCGDSHTHGNCGYDYVGSLRNSDPKKVENLKIAWRCYYEDGLLFNPLLHYLKILRKHIAHIKIYKLSNVNAEIIGWPKHSYIFLYPSKFTSPNMAPCFSRNVPNEHRPLQIQIIPDLP